MEKITTLEQLAEYINTQYDCNYPMVSRIIERNGWHDIRDVLNGVCYSKEGRIMMDEDGKAVVIYKIHEISECEIFDDLQEALDYYELNYRTCEDMTHGVHFRFDMSDDDSIPDDGRMECSVRYEGGAYHIDALNGLGEGIYPTESWSLIDAIRHQYTMYQE